MTQETDSEIEDVPKRQDRFEREMPDSMDDWVEAVRDRFDDTIAGFVVMAATDLWQRCDPVTPITIRDQVRTTGEFMVKIWAKGGPVMVMGEEGVGMTHSDGKQSVARGRRLKKVTQLEVALWLEKFASAGLPWVDLPMTAEDAAALEAWKASQEQDATTTS